MKNFNLNDKTTYPKRQIHLDFHTSGLMENIGGKFNKEAFQKALKTGNVESITMFAKCHHGFCYYPTKISTMHPNVNFDLIGEMIDAAHEIGVRAPVYITAGWSAEDAEKHPKWRARNKDNSYSTESLDPHASGDEQKPFVSWYYMCLNDGSYCRYIYDITREICDRYENLDGLFYDICFMGGSCYCSECIKGMREMGLDPNSEKDADTYYVKKHVDFTKKCTEILHQKHPNATIYFNSGGADADMPQFHGCSTHFEMEDLPTAWGGYNKMAPKARFFERTGKFYLGMTGKFHLIWGEFGGFKSREALRYEVAYMALYGAGASIGDHLFPDGEMDMETYKNIGYAYDYLEKITPYCYDGKYETNIGVYHSTDVLDRSGIIDILLENQLDFRFIMGDDFDGLTIAIVPNGVVLDDEELGYLNKFIENGGKVIFCGNSLQKDGKFQIDCGLKNPEQSKFDCDYICAEKLDADIPKSPFLAYIPSIKAEKTDAKVLAETLDPLFSRTYAKYSGHRNTPYNKEGTRNPAMAKKGNVVYIAHSIGAIYKTYGSIFHRRYFICALDALSYERITTLSLGSGGRVTTLIQEDKKRYCINMTYASPVSRGEAEIIDEILPQYNIPISLKTDKEITKVYDLDENALEFTSKNGKCYFTLPKLNCQETVILEYK